MKRWTWQEKVRAELRERGWSVADLWRQMRLPRYRSGLRQMHRWLDGKSEPREGVLGATERALSWPPGYLSDPAWAWPMRLDQRATEAALDALSPGAREIVVRLRDHEVVAFLGEQLHLYDRLRGGRAGRR